MATYGFLSRFMQAKDNAAAQLQGSIDALKGQNGRAGLMDDASASGQVATDAITNPGATTSLNAPAVGGVQPSGNPSGTTAATGAGERGGTTPNGAATTAGGAATTAGMPVVPDAVEATRLSPDIYHWNSDFLTNYLEAPITPEEQEKRTRAAHAVAGIGNLGNVLSAFSNLAFAGQAPSQTLPQVPEAGTAVNKERDRWDKVRREYVNGKLQGRKLDLDEFRMMQGIENEAAKIKNENQRENFRMNMMLYGQQYKEARDKIADEQWQKKFDEDVRRDGLDRALRKQQLAIQAGHLALQRNEDRRAQARHDSIMQNGGYTYGGRRGGYGGRAAEGELLEAPSGSYRWGVTLKNKETVDNMYENLPPEIKAEYDKRISSSFITTKDSELLKREAIARAAANSDDYVQELVRLKYLSPVAVNGGGGSAGTMPGVSVAGTAGTMPGVEETKK